MGTNPENRIARTIIWMVVAGCLVVGVMNLGLYWFKCRHDHVTMNPGRCLYLSIPIVIGMAVAIKNGALAEWIDQYLDQ